MDVGCGSGYLTAAMARMNPELKVAGYDIYPEIVKLANANINRAVSGMKNTNMGRENCRLAETSFSKSHGH